MSGAGRACSAVALAGALVACGPKPALVAPEARAVEPATGDAADLARIRKLAPDFLARAERARERANTAASPEAAREYAATADLLLEAAQLEADRIELARQLEFEALQRDATLRALAAERYRALERRTADAIARAASAPATGIQPQSAPKPSVAELTQRARLQLAAARVLGADASQLAEAERRVRQAGARPDQARAALEHAERVLAGVRGPIAPPNSDRR